MAIERGAMDTRAASRFNRVIFVKAVLKLQRNGWAGGSALLSPSAVVPILLVSDSSVEIEVPAVLQCTVLESHSTRSPSSAATNLGIQNHVPRGDEKEMILVVVRTPVLCGTSRDTLMVLPRFRYDDQPTSIRSLS